MGLSLVVGPAHAGKVALLLERYLEALDRDPWLIVPNRSDVDRVERDLLRRRPGLVSGRIGTFDDLFTTIAAGAPGWRPVASDVQRALAARRAIASTRLEGLAASAGSHGFTSALLETLDELGSALVDPARLDGDLARLARAYASELERLELCDRGAIRRQAVERIESDLSGWSGEPVFAYGFEDLTAAEWRLVEALAARTDVTVSVPYEPGRAAFSSLEHTVADLAGLAAGTIDELPPASDRVLPPALAHLERAIFEDAASPAPPLDGAIRFVEAAGGRGTAEVVAAEIARLLRTGVAAERIGVVCDSVERWRTLLDTAFASPAVPFVVERPLRITDAAFGRSLLALLRFAWEGGKRSDLFVFLRSPFSGLERRNVDFVEGRLRGRAITDPARVEEEAERLRGAPLPALAALRSADAPASGARELARTMMRNAWGLEAPPVGDAARADARACQAALRTLDELEQTFHSDLATDDVLGALEATTFRLPGVGERGRVPVVDYGRARTRTFDTVFVLGLEEGSFPRRERPSPFLDDDSRRGLDARLERPDSVARDRYLFYTACTRAERRLYLVREAANDEGVPREPSPFWDEVCSLFPSDEVSRATQRRPLSSLTWSLEAAPSERERLRALAIHAVDDPDGALTLASANDWSRRLQRALAAFERNTRLTSPAVLSWVSERTVFSATELERFADCSSAWFVEKVIDPKTIDAQPDALLRGQVVHSTLSRFYAQLPKELDSERVTPENVDGAVALVSRCLDEAFASGVRLELTPLQEAELRATLLSDLEGFVRDEAESEVRFVPRKLEVAFGSERAAPELQRGLALGDGLSLSGKIDRIDLDPFSARGIVQDYKSGVGAHSARSIERERRLQIPLYSLVLRDLVGVEPLGGIYRALSGKRVTRGMLRESARDDLPGFAKDDYLDEDAFWEQTEIARARAGEYAQRIRAGDVQHDPKGDGCPPWCDLWPMCRVKRP